MKRLTAKLAHGFARLAFWRKPDAPTPEQAERPPDAPHAAPADDTTDAPAGRIAAAPQISQDQPPSLDASIPENADPDPVSAFEAEVPPPRASLLARLAGRFRRQAAPAVQDADANVADSIASPPETDAASDETPDSPGRMRRTLAVLSRKWVWIPAVSLTLLAVMGSMLVLLLQSAQEKTRLQADLRATQLKLEQAGEAKIAADRHAAKPAATSSAEAPVVARLGAVRPQPGFDASGCVVTDKESVSQNLKHCIEAFNRSTGGTRAARSAP